MIGVDTPIEGTAEGRTNLQLAEIGDARFINPTGYNYHPLANSPVIDQGSSPGMVDGIDISPMMEYVHPARSTRRVQDERIDIGAYEFIKPDTGLGISNSELAQEVRIWPNPATDRIVIKAPSIIADGKAHILFYSISGALIDEGEHFFKNGESVLDRNELAAGVYILMLKHDKQHYSIGMVHIH